MSFNETNSAKCYNEVLPFKIFNYTQLCKKPYSKIILKTFEVFKLLNLNISNMLDRKRV